MKTIWGVLMIFISQNLSAAPLKIEQFKQQNKAYYADAELKLADLNQALDQKQHPSILIEKACAYSTSLKNLKAFSKKNQHLAFAQEEYAFVSQLDDGFKQSLAELGTSYETGCKAQLKSKTN